MKIMDKIFLLWVLTMNVFAQCDGNGDWTFIDVGTLVYRIMMK